MTQGLRERKKLDTRLALAEAALRLAITRGYHHFTIADVTGAVGVSRRTFSNYFAGKAECLVAVADERVGELIDGVANAPAQLNLQAVLQAALVRFAQQVAEGFDEFVVLVESEPELQAASAAGDAAIVERIAAAVTQRIGAPAGDLRALLLAGFALDAGKLCMQRWLAGGRGGGVPALKALLDHAFTLIDISALSARPS